MIIFLIQDTRHALDDKSWFISTPWAALSLLDVGIQLDSQSVVYDLGCGDGRILASLHARHPEASYCGIEDNIAVLRLALLRNVLRRSPRFVLKRGNFFAEPLHGATHVIAYLPAITIDKIYKKLQQELRPGSIFASFDVPLTAVLPTRVIRSEQNPNSSLYLYTL